MNGLTQSNAWRALESHYRSIAPRHMRDLFAEDPGRCERFSLRVKDILLDYSKNRITPKTISLLVDLAKEADVEGWRDRISTAQRSIPPRTVPCCISHSVTARTVPSSWMAWT